MESTVWLGPLGLLVSIAFFNILRSVVPIIYPGGKSSPVRRKNGASESMTNV